MRLLPEVTKFKLQNQSFNHNLRKFFFSARTVNIWDSLPNYVVDVQSIDVLKVRLDKFWAQKEVMFDWTADLTGTGDRSEYTVESNQISSYNQWRDTDIEASAGGGIRSSALLIADLSETMRFGTFRF